MIRIFKSKLIRETIDESELTQLETDFRRYKQEGVLPDLFGRDVPYDHPNTLPVLKQEEVKHLHLLEQPIRKLQFYRTSDSHLVYYGGFNNPDIYLFMALLRPDAHQQARQNEAMYQLGVMAQNFRKRY
ncbi:type II toxin-antitoxin system YafO family toxin [Oceanospirillum beijerinckii]|uniref:type II toxin-antitoxin system YafO family toxin n=1 Tax=Oceanospirillum beijerinckii TaxID=64976 RepID=UPI0005662F82|nr:type II toxin-antitoxin system YafO family toxin [Oceanospirillum beijerinckii]